MTFRYSHRTVVILAPLAVLVLGLLYTVVIPVERAGATTTSLGPVQPGLCQLLMLLMHVTAWGSLSTGLSSLGPSPVAAVGSHVILRGLRVFSLLGVAFPWSTTLRSIIFSCPQHFHYSLAVFPALLVDPWSPHVEALRGH